MLRDYIRDYRLRGTLHGSCDSGGDRKVGQVAERLRTTLETSSYKAHRVQHLLHSPQRCTCRHVGCLRVARLPARSHRPHALRGGRSVHRHVYPCAEVSMAHPLLRAHQSPRVLKPGRGCRKSTPPCDVPLLCLPVGAVPAEQLLDLLDVGEEVRDQISPHLGGHRCVVRPLVHLGW